ncbi:MAG: DUF3631 domain-containing protein [Candidatus Dormibacteria bacterium]
MDTHNSAPDQGFFRDDADSDAANPFDVDDVITETPEPEGEAVARLAGLSLGNYDREREATAGALGIRLSTLDALVEAARPKPAEAPGRRFTLRVPDPWPNAVAIGDILNELETAVLRHLVVTRSAAVAIGLWIAHTWCFSMFGFTPRLGIISPAPRCGKSTLLKIIELTARCPLKADNISASGTFRTIEALSPLTLLLDECDSYLAENEELRGVLNSGYEKSGAIIRVVEIKDEWQPVRFRTFAPVALSAIKRLPATILDRAVCIPMQRAPHGSKLTKFRHGGSLATLEAISRKLRRWSEDDAPRLSLDPVIPDALNDRAADVSVPLLAIAQQAGGEWPAKAMSALCELFGAAEDGAEETGAMLLADVRNALDGDAVISTRDLLDRLIAIEARPWCEWRHGKPMTPRQLAVALRPFGVRPGTHRTGADRVTGYRAADFADSFHRYLPHLPVGSDRRHADNVDIDTSFANFQPPTRKPCRRSETPEKPQSPAGCQTVGDPKHPSGGGRDIEAAEGGWEAVI